MIYDRTQQDVDKASELFETKVKAFIPLTAEEEAIMERGRVTIDTLNRIENNQKYIHDALKQIGYSDLGVTNKKWSGTEVFYDDDLKRLVDNTKILRDNFFVYSQNIENPSPYFRYTDFNNIEKLLDEMSDIVIKILFWETNETIAGAYNAGQTINLPLKGVG